MPVTSSYNGNKLQLNCDCDFIQSLDIVLDFLRHTEALEGLHLLKASCVELTLRFCPSKGREPLTRV